MYNLLEKQAEISDNDLIITNSIRQSIPPLPLHFNSDNGNINNIKVCILKSNFKDTKHRKLIELQFIIKYKSSKLDHNKDISTLSRHNTFKHKCEILPNVNLPYLCCSNFETSTITTIQFITISLLSLITYITLHLSPFVHYVNLLW